MANEHCRYGRFVTVSMGVERAVAAAKAALKEEGFGVLSEIDVAKTLKEKVGAEIEPYVILGACNPLLAKAGLAAEPSLGLLLPCNVVVRQSGGATLVGAIDALSMLEVTDNNALEPIANDANVALGKALDRLSAS
jgi:uncharacterized protein (DUF302 family)